MLVISMFGDEDHVIASIEAGAVGYVHKDAGDTDIAQVLLDVKQGASPISPMVARGLLMRLRSLPCTTEPAAQAMFAGNSELTAREKELLELLARGYTYSEIAQMCGITLHTVQGHIKNIYSKLAVNSRAEAVFEASRWGLIQPIGGKR
jgi:DNA-binding NarL/FixJ family response regulator